MGRLAQPRTGAGERARLSASVSCPFVGVAFLARFGGIVVPPTRLLCAGAELKGMSKALPTADEATELLRRLEKARGERLAGSSKSVAPDAAAGATPAGDAAPSEAPSSPSKPDSNDTLQQSLRLVQRVTDMGLGTAKPPTLAQPKGFAMVAKPKEAKAPTSVAEESYKCVRDRALSSLLTRTSSRLQPPPPKYHGWMTRATPGRPLSGGSGPGGGVPTSTWHSPS